VKPTDRPKPLPVRLPRELVDRIDAVRGMAPRETFVRYLVDKALRAEERRQAKP